MRILVLNDVHMDLRYQPGASADCGRPICCRDIDGPPREHYQTIQLIFTIK